MKNRQRDSGQQCLLQEGDLAQTYFYLSHFLTTKSMAFSNQIIQNLLLAFTIACHSTCQEEGFQATDSPFSYNNNGNNKENTHLETLADTHISYKFFHLAAFIKRCCRHSFKLTVHWWKIYTLTAIHDLPMVKHTLGEGLTGSMRPQFTIETEWFGDGQVGFHGKHRCSRPLFLTEDLSTAFIQATVNTADGVFGTLDFD